MKEPLCTFATYEKFIRSHGTFLFGVSVKGCTEIESKEEKALRLKQIISTLPLNHQKFLGRSNLFQELC